MLILDKSSVPNDGHIERRNDPLNWNMGEPDGPEMDLPLKRKTKPKKKLVLSIKKSDFDVHRLGAQLVYDDEEVQHNDGPHRIYDDVDEDTDERNDVGLPTPANFPSSFDDMDIQGYNGETLVTGRNPEPRGSAGKSLVFKAARGPFSGLEVRPAVKYGTKIFPAVNRKREVMHDQIAQRLPKHVWDLPDDEFDKQVKVGFVNKQGKLLNRKQAQKIAEQKHSLQHDKKWDHWGEGLHAPELAAHARQQRTDKNFGKSRKLHYRTDFQGLPISIETRKGAVREYVDENGPGKVKLKHAYGYFRLSEGSDGDHVDVIIGPDADSEHVFIVRQVHPDTGKYDEDKVVVGAHSREEAKKIYCDNYHDGERRIGYITYMSMQEFRKKLKATRKRPGMVKSATDPFIRQRALKHKKTGAMIVGGPRDFHDKMAQQHGVNSNDYHKLTIGHDGQEYDPDTLDRLSEEHVRLNGWPTKPVVFSNQRRRKINFFGKSQSGPNWQNIIGRAVRHKPTGHVEMHRLDNTVFHEHLFDKHPSRNHNPDEWDAGFINSNGSYEPDNDHTDYLRNNITRMSPEKPAKAPMVKKPRTPRIKKSLLFSVRNLQQSSDTWRNK